MGGRRVEGIRMYSNFYLQPSLFKNLNNLKLINKISMQPTKQLVSLTPFKAKPNWFSIIVSINKAFFKELLVLFRLWAFLLFKK